MYHYFNASLIYFSLSGEYLGDNETYFVNCSRDELSRNVSMWGVYCRQENGSIHETCIESEKKNCEAAQNEICVVLQREYNYKWMPRGCQERTKYICQSG